jgi:hypothetical protein
MRRLLVLGSASCAFAQCEEQWLPNYAEPDVWGGDTPILVNATTAWDSDGPGAFRPVFVFFTFLQLFSQADPRADMDGAGSVTIQDFTVFLSLFATGC